MCTKSCIDIRVVHSKNTKHEIIYIFNLLNKLLKNKNSFAEYCGLKSSINTKQGERKQPRNNLFKHTIADIFEDKQQTDDAAFLWTKYVCVLVTFHIQKAVCKSDQDCMQVHT